MVKEILVVLQKKIKKGSLRFTVVESVPNPEGGFPIQKPLQNAKVTISQPDNPNPVLTGYTSPVGIYQVDFLPIGLYNWKVELDADYETQSGTAEVVE